MKILPIGGIDNTDSYCDKCKQTTEHKRERESEVFFLVCTVCGSPIVETLIDYSMIEELPTPPFFGVSDCYMF